jgi:hypothetical protein
LPIKQQVERCSIHAPRAKSSTFCSGKDGRALKSSVSKSLATGKAAARMRAARALAERAATSSSTGRRR